MSYQTIVALTFAAIAVVELLRGQLLQRRKTTTKDLFIEAGSGACLVLLTVPLVTWASAGLTERLVPGSEDMLAHWPWWLMFATLLVADDLTQYCWHRLSHTIPALYMLHRAHHSAEYMSVRITYRNNVFYYAFIPGLWLSGALAHMGFGSVYAVYYVVKMAVIMGAHSSVPWDERLLRIRWLRPLMWIVVRVISTPSTHAAHHGKHAADGVTHYSGNFGNFLFLWDVLFGTAKITGRRPQAYGLENVEPATWQEELLRPLPGWWRALRR